MVRSRDNQVMTVQEVAIYLRMRPVTIYKHAAKGKLPGFKVGAAWRFKRKTIDRWIAGQERNMKNSNELSSGSV